ncbi:protein kinase [Rhodococcus sp. D2-41]|uniref:protein kinase domain-containing protein n=1 Tax=Speluncibacter jeojiensis TaxID=2710754 RepID=UPI0024105D35|nr:protein kinase [Rhodococcus sp. D2-41]MDG3010161.1 protein kinase [Rhodococcus sp. D2-41]
MVECDPFKTQCDVGSVLAAELDTAGFEDAEEIGQGGFGTVYRCAQPELDRIVAVKVLTAELDEPNRARFLREQRAMGRLTGRPGIVTVLQIGETRSGRPYLVMPYHSRGSLAARIHHDGPLPISQVLDLGVTMAGALEVVHGLGIVHRDLKPANILYTDYDEPALTDFGIAHIAGGYMTATGTVTGSPAFTAPEVLGGDPPTPASDIYGLGATLFSALTGHAAYERRSGEQVIAQFLRITTAPVPDLRERGIPDQVSTIIEHAMARDPRERPSAAALSEQLKRVRGGFAETVARPDLQEAFAGHGKLPAELTSFVGRRAELTEICNALSTSRLVTLVGLGGVGKTRLALRAAASVQRTYADGVWLVELGEVRDPALVVDQVAAAVGVRDYAGGPLRDLLVEVMSTRSALLVIDNCEQVIDAVAELVQVLLERCLDLRILATSREPFGLGGEVLVQVAPLTTPRLGTAASLRVLSRIDSIALFVQRAATAVQGFELTERNMVTVAAICRRLDGLPLAIELATARLRALSPEQILERLTDRYALLTRGGRGVPIRQQTLRWSIGWSYDLCTPEEQQLWGRLSLFVGSFDIDDVENVCGAEIPDVIDTVSALVDKSILIRDEVDGWVRFRLLDTVRDYGREKVEHTDEYADLRRRQRDWYQRLALEAEAGWIGPLQLDWIARLRRELPNLRDALEFSLAEPGDNATRIAVALYPFWVSRGLFGEGLRWLNRALDRPGDQSARQLAKALYAACVLGGLQGDLEAATARLDRARALDTGSTDPTTYAFVAAADGFVALCSGDPVRARARLTDAVDAPCASTERALQLTALRFLGWAHMSDDPTRALAYHEKALALSESYGEFLHRGYALWAIGIDAFRAGDHDRVVQRLEAGLRLTRRTDDQFLIFQCLLALSWIAAERHEPRRAAVLMGAAEARRRLIGSNSVLYPALLVHQQRSEEIVRQELGPSKFEASQREGGALSDDAAIAFALGEQAPGHAAVESKSAHLTKRERQIASLVAEGLTNKAIASRLVISRRTAEGHVEHILTKLGFTSRAQIAAWATEQGAR